MMHHVILIESQWNLNSGVVAMSFTNNLDINRITVEFKFSELNTELCNARAY